jgi:nicotinamide-nucleotide amidase
MNSYATPLKERLLQVSKELIAREGVIHADVAMQMAEGARKATVCDGVATTWGIGTTGVAGPDSQDGKPVGTVFIGVASDAGSRFEQFRFAGGRDEIREETVFAALTMLKESLLARQRAKDAV